MPQYIVQTSLKLRTTSKNTPHCWAFPASPVPTPEFSSSPLFNDLPKYDTYLWFKKFLFRRDARLVVDAQEHKNSQWNFNRTNGVDK